jgi:hypothetical protein
MPCVELTQRSRILLKKVAFAQLVKNSEAYYQARHAGQKILIAHKRRSISLHKMPIKRHRFPLINLQQIREFIFKVEFPRLKYCDSRDKTVGFSTLIAGP